MYTIYVTNNNELVTSIKTRIMQKSKLIDAMHFLVPEEYNGFKMDEFICSLEYVTPVSHNYKSEVLDRQPDLYEAADGTKWLEYKIPMDTEFTAEAGNVQVQLTFVKADLDPEGNPIQYVRKTSTGIITIVPISRWSDLIPDQALNALDQKLVAVDAKIKELEDAAELYNSTKADDISLDNYTHELYLMADGKEIGTRVPLIDLGDSIVDASPEGLVQMII